MPPWVIIAIAIGAYLLSKKGDAGVGAGTAATASPPQPAIEPAGSGLSAIIDALWARQQRDLPALRARYNVTRLQRVARAAAEAWGVPPEWVWGIMWRESKWTPIGIYAHDPAKAKARKTSAFGMSQMLPSRFNAERAWANEHYPGSIPWSHQDLVDPQKTVWTVAASLRRALEKHGEAKLTANGALLLGQWWAGFSDKLKDAAARKAGDIDDKGPYVSAASIPASLTPNQAGPSDAQDDLPPASADYPGSAGGWMLSGVETDPATPARPIDVDGYWEGFYDDTFYCPDPDGDLEDFS